MMGAFQDGMLALDRVRRGGKQTGRVVHQHVAVGPGGQAVVAAGGVKGGESAGGGPKMTAGPHASRSSRSRLAKARRHARQLGQRPSMRRQDPQGRALPIGGYAERAVQNARWQEHWPQDCRRYRAHQSRSHKAWVLQLGLDSPPP
jgi:hypothetical protein